MGALYDHYTFTDVHTINEGIKGAKGYGRRKKLLYDRRRKRKVN